jgi:hypothetical protein
MNKINVITHLTAQTTTSVAYTKLDGDTSQFGFGAQVRLDNRVLENYQELDKSPGGDTVAEVVLSILGFHANAIRGDSRMTVYLTRCDSGQMVGVDLAVCRRRHLGCENYLVRFMGERELGSDEV